MSQQSSNFSARYPYDDDEAELQQNAPNSVVGHQPQQNVRISFASNIFFVLGSVLYLVMSVDDYQWSHALAELYAASAAAAASASGGEETNANVYYGDLYWHQLPDDQRDCAATMGYDEQLWNSGGTPSETDAWWADLADDVRQAAECLGYSAELWDNAGGDTTADAEADNVSQDTTRDVTVLGEMDDDYVFDVPLPSGRQARVSRYMMIYFSAALCFVIMGILECFISTGGGGGSGRTVWSLIYPGMLVLAGLFGMASAMVVERNIGISNILNLISVHFFFIEAIAIAQHHLSGAVILMHDGAGAGRYLKWFWSFADVLFGTGALIDVVLSYMYVFDAAVDSNTRVAASNVAAQALWLVCSMMYLSHTIALGCCRYRRRTTSKTTSGYCGSSQEQSATTTNSKDFHKAETDISSEEEDGKLRV